MDAMDTSSPRPASPSPDKIISAADAMLQLSSTHMVARAPPSTTSKKCSAAYTRDVANAWAKLEQGASQDQRWRNNLTGLFNSKNENINAGNGMASMDGGMANAHKVWTGASMDLSNSSEDTASISNISDSRNGNSTFRGEAYLLKRQKNNEAAKRSREKRRQYDNLLAHRCKELEVETEQLHSELKDIKSYYGLPVDKRFVAPKQSPFHNQGMMPSHQSALNQSLNLFIARHIAQLHNKTAPIPATTTHEQKYHNLYETGNGGPFSVQPPSPLKIPQNNCNSWLPQDVIADPEYANSFSENGVHSQFADTPCKIEPLLKIPRPTLVEDEDDVSLQSTETHSRSDSCETVSWKNSQDLPVNQISPIERRHTVTTCDWPSNINKNCLPPKLRTKYGFFSSCPGSGNQSKASFQAEHNTPGPSIETHELASDMMAEPFQLIPSVNMQLLNNQHSQASRECMSEPHSPESCTSSILASDISSSEDAMKYAQRRWKNNLAAKKCRDQKKAHMGLSSSKANHLQVCNDILKGKISSLYKERNTLKELLDQKNQASSRGEIFLPPKIEDLRVRIEQCARQ